MNEDRYSVLFTEGAAAQVQRVDEWWRKERPAAPTLFSDELSRAVARLRTAPGSGAPFESTAIAGSRRVLLTGSGYHLYYTVDLDRCQVLVRAVWHASRGHGPELA